MKDVKIVLVVISQVMKVNAIETHYVVVVTTCQGQK